MTDLFLESLISQMGSPHKKWSGGGTKVEATIVPRGTADRQYNSGLRRSKGGYQTMPTPEEDAAQVADAGRFGSFNTDTQQFSTNKAVTGGTMHDKVAQQRDYRDEQEIAQEELADLDAQIKQLMLQRAELLKVARQRVA